ncbi:hypothetical protein B4135_1009 [Caldibacillus debilis]|uniref:Uncharacterized protein n=1 Tax=Caldibacillus debilis TaxID=301148 RepID=A0A150MF06_9BACI|nr:hypothetical protein B4135_1009 [Caldibacillus debilis]
MNPENAGSMSLDPVGTLQGVLIRYNLVKSAFIRFRGIFL